MKHEAYNTICKLDSEKKIGLGEQVLILFFTIVPSYQD